MNSFSYDTSVKIIKNTKRIRICIILWKKMKKMNFKRGNIRTIKEKSIKNLNYQVLQNEGRKEKNWGLNEKHEWVSDYDRILILKRNNLKSEEIEI